MFKPRLFNLLLSFSLLTACQTPAQAAEPAQAVRSQAQAPLSRYDIRALPWGNLFYQIDCLAGQGYCSESTFRELWKQLGWTAEDEQRLNSWKTLKARYSRQIQFSGGSAGLPLPANFDGIVFWDKIRQTGLNATDRQNLALNLAAVMQPADAEALIEILEAFENRFFGWWQTQGQTLAEKGAGFFAAQLQKPELPALIAQASVFYQAKLSDRSVLGFNFLARPNLGARNLSGEQIDNQSLVEVLENGTPNLDVTIHELCHYFYDRMSEEDEKQIMQRFAAANSPEAIAAYNLLNEVLATAIGNALLNRQLLSAEAFAALLAKKGGLYNDDFIDPLAKAVYLRVEQALKQAEPVYSEAFVKDYLALAQQAPGLNLRSPIPLLRTAAIAYEGEDMAPVMRQLQTNLRIGRAWGANAFDERARSTFTNFAAISGLILIKNNQIERLQDWENLLGKPALADITNQAKSGRSFVYGVARNSSSRIFVMVAPGASEFKPLIEKLAATPQIFTGLLP